MRVGLPDTREVVRLRKHGVPSPERIISLLETWVTKMDQAMRDLAEARGRLADVLHRARSAAADGEALRLC